nr:glycine cleavage system protein T [Actinomycetota bacterium]
MRTAIRRSPAARLSARLGAVFVEESGWEIPASYGDDAAERAAIR